MIDLPPRAGERPETTSTNPHQQRSQNPGPEVYELLLSKVIGRPRASRSPRTSSSTSRCGSIPTTMAVTIETYKLHAWQQIPIVELRG